MITCRQLLDFLHDYVEGDLPAAERARFEQHLSVCDPCVGYLEEYRRTVRLARREKDVPAEALPEALVRAILAARSKDTNH